jgi:predicted amidophosphoribosyltransferase
MNTEILTPVFRTKYKNVRYIAYRWYFPLKYLPWADSNGERFHHWILRLKNGDQSAIDLFKILLVKLLEMVGEQDGIIAIPPHHSFRERPEYPLGEVAEYVSCMKKIKNTAYNIERIKTLKPVVEYPPNRDPNIQALSMELYPLPEGIKSILLIDDVATSWSTMNGAAQTIKEVYPELSITCFAFGKTKRTRSSPFPANPKFPTVEQLTEEKRSHWLDHVFE